MIIKCIACIELKRRELKINGEAAILYDCPHLPYMTSIGGLMRPGSGTIKGAEACPENPRSHCAICSETKIQHYGHGIVSICPEHDKAWGQWLDEHPEKREHIAPRGRAIRANWVEVFREFVEYKRGQNVTSHIDR